MLSRYGGAAGWIGSHEHIGATPCQHIYVVIRMLMMLGASPSACPSGRAYGRDCARRSSRQRLHISNRRDSNRREHGELAAVCTGTPLHCECYHVKDTKCHDKYGRRARGLLGRVHTTTSRNAASPHEQDASEAITLIPARGVPPDVQHSIRHLTQQRGHHDITSFRDIYHACLPQSRHAAPTSHALAILNDQEPLGGKQKHSHPGPYHGTRRLPSAAAMSIHRNLKQDNTHANP